MTTTGVADGIVLNYEAILFIYLFWCITIHRFNFSIKMIFFLTVVYISIIVFD